MLKGTAYVALGLYVVAFSFLGEGRGENSIKVTSQPNNLRVNSSNPTIPTKLLCLSLQATFNGVKGASLLV
jgi:hypothetical protein